MTSLQSSK